MISTLIVLSTVFMAMVFTVAYCISPELRRRVEQPKFIFLRQLAQYDRSLEDRSESSRETPEGDRGDHESEA